MLIWFIQLPITGLQPLYQGVKKDLDILHQSRFFSLVPEDGLEPSRYHYRWILSPLRLPIPPLGQQQLYFTTLL